MAPDRRSDCPIACTLDLLGDKWTLVVVRDLFMGNERFEQFLSSPEGIATNILADRLARLREAGLVEQHANPDRRDRPTYHLTRRGRGLRPLIRAMVRWGLKNVPGTKVPRPASLGHAAASD